MILSKSLIQSSIVIFIFICFAKNVFSFNELSKQVTESSKYLEIVDPNSKYFQQQTVEKSLDQWRDDDNDLSNKNTECKSQPCEAFSRRLVNMLLLSANLKEKNGITIGQLNFEATVEEIEILKAFGEGKHTYKEVDILLENFIRPAEAGILDKAVNLTELLSIYIYQHRIIFGAFLVLAFVVTISMKVRWTRWRVIILLFDIMVIISFVLTWWELLQEVNIKLSSQQTMFFQVPDECNHQELGFFKSLWLFFGYGKGECFKYFEAKLSDPELKVTPLDAFSHMLTRFFLHPLTIAGTYLSQFIAHLTSNLPFPINYVAMIMLMLFLPFLISMLIFVRIAGSLEIAVGPLFRFSLRGRRYENQHTSHVENSNMRQSIQILDPKHVNQENNCDTPIKETVKNQEEEYKIIKETDEDLPEKVDAALDPIEELNSDYEIIERDLVIYDKNI